MQLRRRQRRVPQRDSTIASTFRPGVQRGSGQEGGRQIEEAASRSKLGRRKKTRPRLATKRPNSRRAQVCTPLASRRQPLKRTRTAWKLHRQWTTRQTFAARIRHYRRSVTASRAGQDRDGPRIPRCRTACRRPHSNGYRVGCCRRVVSGVGGSPALARVAATGAEGALDA